MGNSKGIQQALKEAYQGLQEYFCYACGMESVLMWGIENRPWNQETTTQPAV